MEEMRKIDNRQINVNSVREYKILKVNNTLLATRFYCNYLGFKSISISRNIADNPYSVLKFANTRLAIYPEKMKGEGSNSQRTEIKIYVAHKDIKKIYLNLLQKVSLLKNLHHECNGCLSFSVLDCEDNVLKYVAAY